MGRPTIASLTLDNQRLGAENFALRKTLDELQARTPSTVLPSTRAPATAIQLAMRAARVEAMRTGKTTLVLRNTVTA